VLAELLDRTAAPGIPDCGGEVDNDVCTGEVGPSARTAAASPVPPKARGRFGALNPRGGSLHIAQSAYVDSTARGAGCRPPRFGMS